MTEAVTLKSLAFRVLERRAGPAKSVPSASPAVGHAGSPSEAAAEAHASPVRPTVQAGAILLAPRYDGGGKPLAAIPECWCCRATYRLQRLEEWRGKTYAWLEPGCGCLDARMCYGCFVCREHCRCGSNRNSQ